MPPRPDALVIGAQKCATTWLFQCMTEHPDLFLPRHKREVEYIASPLYARAGLCAYWSLFEAALPYEKVVDVSVEYMFDPAAAAVVAREMPEAKLIVSLRNPVDRACSAYSWLLRKAFIPDVPLDIGMQRVIESAESRSASDHGWAYRDILERGFYDIQIARYLQRFARDRLLVVVYDDIRETPAAVLESVWAFLGASAGFRPTTLRARPKMTTNFRPAIWLERTFPRGPGARAPTSSRIAGKIADSLGQLARVAGKRMVRPQLDASTRAALRSIYTPHLIELKALLAGVTMAAPRRDLDFITSWL